MVSDDGNGTFTAAGGKGGRLWDEDLAAFTHARGVVSLANQGPDTNGCQFFITTAVGAAAARDGRAGWGVGSGGVAGLWPACSVY